MLYESLMKNVLYTVVILPTIVLQKFTLTIVICSSTVHVLSSTIVTITATYTVYFVHSAKICNKLIIIHTA